MLGLMLATCARADMAEECELGGEPLAEIVAVEGFEAPWDPVHIEVELAHDDGTVIAGPIPVFSDSVAWPLEPLLDPPYVTEQSGLYRFTEEPRLAEMASAGLWATPEEQQLGLDGLSCAAPTPADWVAHQAKWTVGDYGRADDFDPNSIVGSWEIRPQLVLAGGDPAVQGAASSYLDLSLEVLDVSDGRVEFRLVSHEYGDCVLLDDVGALSSTGEFTWSEERLEAATEPAPLVLYAPRIRLGFNGGDEAAGGEVSAIVDVRASEGGDEDVCEWMDMLGVACEPCADDGHPSCLPLAGYAWTAQRVDAAVGEELPLCGFDFSDTGEVPDFDYDCGWDGTLCAFASFISVAPLLRKRRRDDA